MQHILNSVDFADTSTALAVGNLKQRVKSNTCIYQLISVFSALGASPIETAEATESGINNGTHTGREVGIKMNGNCWGCTGTAHFTEFSRAALHSD